MLIVCFHGHYAGLGIFDACRGGRYILRCYFVMNIFDSTAPMSDTMFSIGVMIGRNVFSLAGVNTRNWLGWHFISMVSFIVTGSPSKCAGPV